MYSQTCCFVGPTIDYGIFKASPKEYYIATDRAVRNMAFQGIFTKVGQVEKVAEIQDSDLVGMSCQCATFSPQGRREGPSHGTISPVKGTGIVTSVLSDSPNDFITVTYLSKKASYIGIKKEWAELCINGRSADCHFSPIGPARYSD